MHLVDFIKALAFGLLFVFVSLLFCAQPGAFAACEGECRARAADALADCHAGGGTDSAGGDAYAEAYLDCLDTPDCNGGGHPGHGNGNRPSTPQEVDVQFRLTGPAIIQPGQEIDIDLRLKVDAPVYGYTVVLEFDDISL